MSKYPPTVVAVLVFLLANALVWIGFALLAVAGAHEGLPSEPAVRWIMAGLAFGCGCVLIGLAAALARRIRIAYFLVTAVLAVLAVLTVTDDVGWIDLAYMALVVIPLALLLKDRKWYLRQNSAGLNDR
jgi:lysylphosphatidylglycerol synthetase-like protein (DUF2156 family)